MQHRVVNCTSLICVSAFWLASALRTMSILTSNEAILEPSYLGDFVTTLIFCFECRGAEICLQKTAAPAYARRSGWIVYKAFAILIIIAGVFTTFERTSEAHNILAGIIRICTAFVQKTSTCWDGTICTERIGWNRTSFIRIQDLRDIRC